MKNEIFKKRAIKLAIAAGIGLTFYFLLKKIAKKQTPKFSLPNQAALKILIEFRREFFPVFSYLAALSNYAQFKIKSAHFQFHSNSFNDLLSEKLTSQNPTLNQMVLSVQQKIYAKHQIQNAERFQHFCLELRKIDESVDFVIKDIQNQYKKAVFGELEEPQVALPIALDIEKVLVTYHDLTVKSLEFLYKLRQEDKPANSADKSDGRIVLDLRQNEGYRNLREEMLREAGFAANEAIHPEQMMMLAVSKYSKQSDFFNEAIQKYDLLSNEICEDLTEKTIGKVDLQKKVWKFLSILNQFLKSKKEQKESLRIS